MFVEIRHKFKTFFFFLKSATQITKNVATILVFVKDSVYRTPWEKATSTQREYQALKGARPPEAKDEQSETFAGGEGFFEGLFAFTSSAGRALTHN